MHLQSIFTASGCSPEVNVVDISDDGMMAFGSGSNVILSNILDSTRLERRLLPGGPKGQVHAVKISSKSKTIIAGSADGKLSTWTSEGGVGPHYDHGVDINALSVTEAYAGGEITVTFSDIKGALYQVILSDGKFIKGQMVSFGLKKIISIASGLLKGALVNFVGTSDNFLNVIVEMKIVLSLPGHFNWINSVDVCSISDDALLVVTGSSDRVIRVWRVFPHVSDEQLCELVPTRKNFTLPGTRADFKVECESILYGHEGAIHSVRWEVSGDSFISAAADHTIIKWKKSIDSDSWTTVLQIGDIGSLGGVGGNRSFGFYSAILFKDPRGATKGDRIVAHGSTGTILQFAMAPSGVGFTSSVLSTGHTTEIESCSWEPRNGAFLATASRDMTSRLWAAVGTEGGGWYELARPQIHGYEMKSIVVLDSEHILSAADEKILRSFEAPSAFKERLNYINSATTASSPPSTSSMTAAVFAPALGLSNKIGNESVAFEAPPNLPPTEYDLGRLSLWIESDKLYGHGLELQCLAVSSCGQIAASASRATTEEDALIRFWQRDAISNTWTALPTTIAAHSLTVVKMVFSPDDRHLLAVSRDRQLSLITIDKSAVTFKLLAVQEAHSRIIWCADWGQESNFFVTGSRDRCLKTWRLTQTGAEEIPTGRIELSSAITAVAIKGDLMAVGTERGSIYIYHLELDGASWKQMEANEGRSTSTITDLKWHPTEQLLAVTSSLLQVYRLSPQ